MISLVGYENLSLIYESANSEVYRGVRQSDNLGVILKLLKQDYSNPSKLIRYQQEFEILSSLDIAGVIKVYGLDSYRHTPVIILEDFGGSSLRRWIKGQLFDLKEFLTIAIEIVTIIGRIHDHNIIHKDINPANIVFNPHTKQLKIIDFGIASVLSQENPTLQNVNVLEGTVAYYSPEQTGRMNRSLDYRTDFYSVGVTFYELLTGELPFKTQDTLELIHCHLAKQPLSPAELRGEEIPPILSALVMKLMAKTAEERYQSAYGIKADLAECLRQLNTKEQIGYFSLATQDTVNKFQIPQKLYGRETQVASLLAAFFRVTITEDGNQLHLSSSRSELFLISGHSGVGKTALVREIYQPLSEQQGSFITGKFEQLQRNIPYSAIVSAFSDLIQQLLSESKPNLDRWRDRLLTALGQNGQVAIDVIPELELIIGQQPSVATLGAIESQNRFNLVFQSFIRVFCTAEHPLVIFLDDLQWADVASLKLLELILGDRDTQYLLLIGAYRHNEVKVTHPFMKMVASLSQQQVKINQVQLAPLNLDCVSQLIADTLHSDRSTVLPLARLIFSKTNGNPFFVNEFLKTFYGEKLINFQASSSTGNAGGSWYWNLAEIKSVNITDNVVELMIAKLRKLPATTQAILQTAACLGGEFDLNSLVIIEEQTPKEIFSALKIALDLGLVIALSELDAQLLIQNYKFGHDRIQQAAYALIGEGQKQLIHLKIGRLLLQHTTAATLSEQLFKIVEQLNLGMSLVTEIAECNLIAHLNLNAAQKAKAATAYEAARKYLQIGCQLLSPHSWQTNYDLTLSIYSEATEVAYLSGDFAQMERFATVVMQQTRSLLDKVKIYRLQIEAQIAQNQNLEAIQTALPILQLLGVSFPPSPTEADIQQELQQTQLNLGTRQIEELRELPTMSDRSKLAAMAITNSIIPSCFIAVPTLLPLIVCQQVNLSWEYGNTSLSACAYVFYGLLLCSMADDIEQGYRFGQLSLKILERFQAQELYANIVAVLYATIEHWQQHLHKSLEPLKFSYHKGLETGDLYHATTSLYLYTFHAFFSGQTIPTLAAEVLTYNEEINKLKQAIPLNYHRIYGQAILNLSGQTSEPCCLKGESYDETVMLPIHQQANDRYALCALHLNKLYLSFLFREYTTAVAHARQAEQYLNGATSTLLIPLFHFYDSLAHLAIFPSSPPAEQQQILLRVNAHQAKMERWAKSAPMNYQHKFDLVLAELHRVQKAYLEAMDCYDRAIAGAKEHDYLNEEALANELTGQFYLDWGKSKIAKVYIDEAYRLYHYWGAGAKIKDIEQTYPQLITKVSNTNSVGESVAINQRTTNESETANSLDLATVMKASQAIVGEIQLDKLLSTLMKILIENAGAQIGYLILNTNEQLSIEAIGAVDRDEIQVLQSLPLEKRLPTSVINYVVRTRKTVLESHAGKRGKFTKDPYIKTHQTKSILCTPLLDRARLSGIIYLENNLTTGAFTPNRLNIIQLLSGQAAIAITNAKFYQELQDSQRRLTQFIDAMPMGVTIHEPNGQIYYANHQAKHLLGIDVLPSAQVEQLSEAYQIYQAGSTTLYPTDKLPVVRALAGETVKVDDVELHHPERIIPLEASTTPICNQMGQIEYAIAAFQDITERKQAEKLLADYNRTLEQKVAERTQALSQAIEKLTKTQKQLVESEKMASLGGLVAGIAHEINTPIGIGVTAASTLTEKTAEFELIYRSGKMKRSQLEKFLTTALQSSSMVLRNLDRAAELIHGFKQVAVDQSSELQRTFKLKLYLQEILIALNPRIKRTKHQIEIQGDEDLTLHTYPGVLAQIITNLILNSLIHAYEPEEAGKIIINFCQHDRQVVLNYSDDGKGIAAENLGQIFEPFFTTRRGQGGSGLGLHLVYNLVTQKLQGIISCQSELGIGTKFKLNFPTQIE